MASELYYAIQNEQLEYLIFYDFKPGHGGYSTKLKNAYYFDSYDLANHFITMIKNNGDKVQLKVVKIKIEEF